MVNKKRSIIIAAIASLLTFLTVAYVSSCSKPGQSKYSCEGVVCQNGGYCDSARCICPIGFEGANCSVPSVAKYIGTWDATQIVTGSDSVTYVHDTIQYTAFLKTTATPTTFFVDNFTGNPYYNEIICTIDSVGTVLNAGTSSPDTLRNTNMFTIDTLSAANMLYAHYQLKSGSGYVTMDNATNTPVSITAKFVVRYVNKTTNFEVDTINLMLTPHHF